MGNLNSEDEWIVQVTATMPAAGRRHDEQATELQPQAGIQSQGGISRSSMINQRRSADPSRQPSQTKRASAIFLMFTPLLGMATNVLARPTFTGHLISAMDTDRARYTQNAQAVVSVTLTNRTSTTFTGTITATTSGRGVLLGSPVAKSVTGLPVGQTTVIFLKITTPANGDYRGYFVDVTALSSSGAHVDEQGESLDLSSTYDVYPRQCWVTATWTSWPSTGHLPEVKNTPEQNIDSLRAWHCNNLQFFNPEISHE